MAPQSHLNQGRYPIKRTPHQIRDFRIIQEFVPTSPLNWTEYEWDFLCCSLMQILGPISSQVIHKALRSSLSRQVFAHNLIQLIPNDLKPRVQHTLSWVIANEHFIARCRLALIDVVGPIGDWLINRYQSQGASDSPYKWVEELAQHIPSPKDAETFRYQVLYYKDEFNGGTILNN